MTTRCTCCDQPLTGGLDTFGAVDTPMCWTCWSDLEFPYDPPSARGAYRKIMLVKEQWKEMDKRHGFD